MIAISAGRGNVASYLIEQEHADVNVINSTGQCCLHYCASKNRLQVSIFPYILDIFTASSCALCI